MITWLKEKWLQFILFAGLEDKEDYYEPVFVNESQIDLNEYVEHRVLLEELVGYLNFLQEEMEDEVCGHYFEGYMEALGMVEHLVHQEIEFRIDTDVNKFHEEIENFMKNQSE